MRRPRALVLDEVWRGLDGVEALSGAHGGPLRRTVKLILDPLVIRPMQYPACAGAVLTGDGATLLTARVHAAADRLRATAAWFTLLKQTRRSLRITEGNAQDLYFQRCFELAVTRGHPDPARDRPCAEATLREIHEISGGRTTQALKEHLADPVTAVRLGALIETAWARRPGPVAAHDHGDLLRDLLDAAASEHLGIDRESPCSSADHDAPLSVEELFDTAVTANAGAHTGIMLWYSAFDVGTSAGSDTVSARGLGLTTHPLPPRPEVGTSAATATLRLPFDRTIHERVFTVLQASTERAELPPIPDLVTEEIARSCSPWALLDETLRATAAAGVVLASGLAPLDRAPLTGLPSADAAPGSGGESAAHRTVNARWRREAYVLQARRLAVHTVAHHTVDVPTVEEAPADRDPLTAIAAELRTPWQPYLRRLWVRLHGRDVRDLPMDAPELWDLLDGVARSVMLDHRTRVRKALSATALAPAADTGESRAS